MGDVIDIKYHIFDDEEVEIRPPSELAILIRGATEVIDQTIYLGDEKFLLNVRVIKTLD